MKNPSIEPTVAARYLEKFSAVINGQNDYWIEQNGAKGLPKGIIALQKAINDKNGSLDTLMKEAKSWSQPSLGYKPEPCLAALYRMILEVRQGNFDAVTPMLSTLTRAQQEYTELGLKLQANQTTIEKAAKSRNKAEEAKAYQERGLLYWDADKILYHRQAFECFSQAIQLKADPS